MQIKLAIDEMTLLEIACKRTDKIYLEFGLDFGYYISSPHLVMNLILKISKEEKDQINDMGQHLFVERLMS